MYSVWLLPAPLTIRLLSVGTPQTYWFPVFAFPKYYVMIFRASQEIFMILQTGKNVNIKLNTFRGKMYNLIKQLRHVVVESK